MPRKLTREHPATIVAKAGSNIFGESEYLMMNGRIVEGGTLWPELAPGFHTEHDAKIALGQIRKSAKFIRTWLDRLDDSLKKL